MTDEQTRDLSANTIMLTIEGVATLLACSPKTVYRLADRRRMPQPIRLGRLMRWPKVALEKWIADGCPASDAQSS